METFAYSPILEIKARTNSFTSNASWRTGKTKNEDEGTWDYVTYHRVPDNTNEATANLHKPADNLTNGNHPEGMKTELVVIEEDLMDDKKSCLGWGVIVLIVVAVLVILGGVGGVLVWQLGLFGSTEQSSFVEGKDKLFEENVTESISTESSQAYTDNVIRNNIIVTPKVTTIRYKGKVNTINLNEHTTSSRNIHHEEATEEYLMGQTRSISKSDNDDNTTPFDSNDHRSITRQIDIDEATTPPNSNNHRNITREIYIDETTPPSKSNDDKSRTKKNNLDDATTPSNINDHENITENVSKANETDQNYVTTSENVEDSIIIDNNNLTEESHSRNVSIVNDDIDGLTKHKDEMIMVLIGGRNSSGKNHQVNELIGGYGSPSFTRCRSLEKFSPNFEGNSGSVFIEQIDAVVSCGYSNTVSMEGKKEPKTESYIFHKTRSVWESAGYPLDKIGLSDGAFTHWSNRIILFGGYGHYGMDPTMSLGIKVFEFSSVEKTITTKILEVDVEGSTEDDDEEVSYEEDFKFFLVEESLKVVSKGGVVGGCAITIEDHEHHVKFIVTGGIDRHQKVTAQASLFELIMVQNNPRVKHHKKIPSMTYERTKHGCTRTTLNGEDVVIVAGGGDINNLPIQHVEFINVKRLDAWRNLGNLNRGRMSSPSIGRVFGKIVVAGGRTLAAAAVDGIDISNKIVATDSMEVYDEEMNGWRDVESRDGFNATKLSSPRYDHIGVVIPYAWCLSG